MPGTARLATAADIGQLACTIARAFAADPPMLWIIGDREFFPAARGAFTVFGQLAFDHGEMWVTDDCAAGTMWYVPGAWNLPAEATKPGVEPLRAAVGDDALHRLTALEHQMEAVHPTEEHWYLGILGTHPDWQGRGLARTVIDPVRRRADADGVALYLETGVPENVSFYGRLGFDVRLEFDVDDGGPHMWGMWREPGAARDWWEASR